MTDEELGQLEGELRLNKQYADRTGAPPPAWDCLHAAAKLLGEVKRLRAAVRELTDKNIVLRADLAKPHTTTPDSE